MLWAGEGSSYGLPENDYSQPGESDLKIISVVRGCTKNHNDMPDKQEPKEEPPPEISGMREGLFAEIKKEDPGSIDIASLSLNIDLEDVTVLRRIFEEKQR